MKPATLAILSFVAGLVLLPLILFLYLCFGQPPVAVADRSFPFESQIVKVPLAGRVHLEMPASSPIPATDDNLNTGAGIYEDKCEICHGIATGPSAIGGKMFPRAPQLWAKHGNGAVGVSDDPAGETWWKIKNGIRLTGMPAYGKVLSDSQIWQVSLLLSRADKPLPAEASRTVGR